MAGKRMRVFDCQDMPEDIKAYFFDHYGEGKSNDVYINVYIEGNCSEKNNICPESAEYQCETCTYMKYDIVEQWLLDNGSPHECIVKRWW